MTYYKIGDITTWQARLSDDLTISIVIHSDTRKPCLIRILSYPRNHHLETTEDEIIVLRYE